MMLLTILFGSLAAAVLNDRSAITVVRCRCFRDVGTRTPEDGWPVWPKHAVSLKKNDESVVSSLVVVW
jgi:hypothetical protein